MTPDAADQGCGHGSADAGPGLDRRRSRATLRITGIGIALGVIAAVLTGVAGGRGRVGAAVFLLVAAVACGAGALHAVAALLLDDLRGRGPSGRRAGLAAGLFALAAALMAMVAGIGG